MAKVGFEPGYAMLGCVRYPLDEGHSRQNEPDEVRDVHEYDRYPNDGQYRKPLRYTEHSPLPNYYLLSFFHLLIPSFTNPSGIVLLK